MTYASDHPVRLVGGRLALDFVNTADWTSEGKVAHEKIEALEDLDVWLNAVNLPDATPPDTIGVLHAARRAIRQAILGPGHSDALIKLSLGADHDVTLARRPILDLVAISALSILADPNEFPRLKMCPGDDCGWIFIDETKNSRRTWCMMETCGNRAKAARHYQRKVQAQRHGS